MLEITDIFGVNGSLRMIKNESNPPGLCNIWKNKNKIGNLRHTL